MCSAEWPTQIRQQMKNTEVWIDELIIAQKLPSTAMDIEHNSGSERSIARDHDTSILLVIAILISRGTWH